jgi:hypothetical protein
MCPGRDSDHPILALFHEKQVINTTTAMPDGMSNPLSNFVTTKRKPALGPTFSALVDATLWLARADQVGADGREMYVAEVFKSRNSACSLRFRCFLVSLLDLENEEIVFFLCGEWGSCPA